MDVPSLDDVIAAIDAFRARHDMAESRFGREATGEPALVATLRGGRDPSIGTIKRLVNYMKAADAKLVEAVHNASDTVASQHVSPGNDTAFSPSVQNG